jgi:hypothetical protein
VNAKDHDLGNGILQSKKNSHEKNWMNGDKEITRGGGGVTFVWSKFWMKPI